MAVQTWHWHSSPLRLVMMGGYGLQSQSRVLVRAPGDRPGRGCRPSVTVSGPSGASEVGVLAIIELELRLKYNSNFRLESRSEPPRPRAAARRPRRESRRAGGARARAARASVTESVSHMCTCVQSVRVLVDWSESLARPWTRCRLKPVDRRRTHAQPGSISSDCQQLDV